MRRTLSALVLTCLIAVPVLAGDMPTIDYAPPPPPPTSPATSGADPGDIPTIDAHLEVGDTLKSVASTILGLLLR